MDVPSKRPPGLFFWLFLLLPIGIAAGTLSIYIHEFSHGLTALALGGTFLGTKWDLSSGYPSQPYADAWSEHGNTLVTAAGIIVNVAIGVLLLRKALRTAPLLPRILLFLLASPFLADLHYAFEGFRYWESNEHDTAVILQDLGSPAPLRWIGLAVLFLALAASFVIQSRGLFRAWEEVLGPLTAGRAFRVMLFLVTPAPWPTTKAALPLFALFFLPTAVCLIRGRRRDVEPTPLGRLGPWIRRSWAAGALAVIALMILARGIHLTTFADQTLFEVRTEEQSAAGLTARYGMGDRWGGNRPVTDPKLFVATPDALLVVPSPVPTVLDLAWLPSRRFLLVAAPSGLYQVDVPGGESTRLWRTDWHHVRAAEHGPGGELLLCMDRPYWSSHPLQPVLYAYDPRTGRGRQFDSKLAISDPYFLPGTPVRARVTVGPELWEFTWGVDDEDGFRVDVLDDAVEEAGWYMGTSGSRHWWSDDDGWWSGDTRIRNEGFANWGVGAEGFYTLDKDGAWRVVTTDGRVLREGRMADPYLLFDIYEGLPWLAFKNGEVRRLEAAESAFRVQLPRPER